MLKKALVMGTLAFCAVMSLQAIEENKNALSIELPADTQKEEVESPSAPLLNPSDVQDESSVLGCQHEDDEKSNVLACDPKEKTLFLACKDCR